MTKLLPLLTLGLAITAAPVAAEPVTEVRVVSVADLDLSTAQGRSALDRRLVRAAIDACGSASDADLEGRNDLRLCRATALAKARAAGEQRIAKLGRDDILIAAR